MWLFAYPSVQTYVFGAQKNRLIETILFEYQQHMFWLRNKKNNFLIRTLIWIPVAVNAPISLHICISCQSRAYTHQVLIWMNAQTMGRNTRKPVFGGLRTTKRRPACKYAKSDQCLCHLLIGKYHIKNCYTQIFNFIASLCSWGDWFEFCFTDRFVSLRPIY